MGTLITRRVLKPSVTNKTTIFLAMVVTAYLFSAMAGLKQYLEWSSVNFIIGMAAMPLMLAVPGRSRFRYRFALLALLLMITGFLVPVKTVLYLSLCCILLWIYESNKTSLTALPLLTLFMMSPVCQYFMHIFSFPIRLWLTGIAGGFLSYMDRQTTVAGNIISFDHGAYSVDPACMGLNMLVTALLCGLILLALYQKRTALALRWPWTLAGLGFIFVLNIVSNLIRILVLVYFKILPDNPMHDIVGIICLIIYVLLPASFLLKRMVLTLGKPSEGSIAVRSGFKSGYLHILLLPCLALLSFHTRQQWGALPERPLPVVKGYHVSWFSKEVIKITNDQALIYIKPLKGFLFTDHNPLICWTGSGYTFEQVRQQHWGNLSLFTGVLHKGGEQLYTAWWYDNGQISTTSQWTWRSQMLRGNRAFSIINVSAGDMETLKKQVAEMTKVKGAMLR